MSHTSFFWPAAGLPSQKNPDAAPANHCASSLGLSNECREMQNSTDWQLLTTPAITILPLLNIKANTTHFTMPLRAED